MPEVIYERAHELKSAASGLIDEYHQHLQDANIAYLWRSGRWYVKGVKQIGKTIVVAQIWHELTGYDLVVVVNKNAYLSQSTQDRIAMLDNLLCQFGMTDNGRLHARDHDIKEFSDAVRRNKVCMSNLPAVDGTSEIKKLDVPDEPEETAAEVEEVGLDLAEAAEAEPLFVIEDCEDIDDTGCTVTPIADFNNR